MNTQQRFPDNPKDDHIELGMLLQKSRSEQKRNQVEEILQGSLSVQEKIREIKRLDQEEDDENKEPRPEKTQVKPIEPDAHTAELLEPQKPPNEEEAREAQEHAPEDSTLKLARKNQERIKQKLAENRFLKFVFNDLAKIKKFGRETHILITGFWFFKIKLNSEIKPHLRDQVQKKLAVELKKATDSTLEHGWKLLKKSDYNLVGILNRLCKAILSANFESLNFKNKYIIDRLQQVERYFLILHSRPEYVNTTASSVEAVLETFGENPETAGKVPSFVKRLLAKDVTLPSFYNFILGLNMFRYNRYLELNDLIRKNIEPLVSHTDFDCTPEVRGKILEFIQEQEALLLPLVQQRDEILRLRAFLPATEKGEIDLAPLESFYDHLGKDRGQVFEKDKDNVLLFSNKLAEFFIRAFQDILTGKIDLEKGGTVSIFSASFFSVEMTRFRYLLDKLERFNFQLPAFPRKRFFTLKKTNKGAIAIEAEAMKVMDDLCTNCLSIGQKLALVLRMRTKPISEHFLPLESTVLQGKQFSLPYENSTIGSPGYLGTKTVAEALAAICSICHLIPLFFGDTRIHAQLAREKRVQEEISAKLAVLERVTQPKTFMTIKTKYNIH